VHQVEPVVVVPHPHNRLCHHLLRLSHLAQFQLRPRQDHQNAGGRGLGHARAIQERDEARAGYLRTPLHQIALGQETLRLAKQSEPTAAFALGHAVFQHLGGLPTTSAATLVIGGRHDPMLSPDTLRQAIVGPIPRARLALLDCGHEIPLEKPQETAALLEAFLAGLG
jgi:pimeloyl-ACP methyl ester carboxylesterase